jgi:hypothetical protein
MKKINKKLKGHKKTSSDLRGGKSSPLIAIAVIVVVSLVGIGLLKASFAQTTGYIYLTVRNKSNNAPISNAVTALGARAGTLCQGKDYWTAYTEPSGVASYACEPGTYFFFDVNYPGYHTVTDGSGYIPGTNFQHNGTTSLTLYMEPWPAPQITLTANPATITKGASSTINWSVQYSDTCSAVGGWQSSNSPSGSKVVAPTSTTTYSLTCSGANYSGTSASKNVTVTVNNPASPPPPPAKSPTPTPPPPSSSTKKTNPAPTPPAPAIVKATSGDTSAPSTPENVGIEFSDNKVLLSWDKSSDNVGVSGYSIERSTDQSEWTTLSSNISEPKYEDSAIEKNTHYYYRIRALDAVGNQSEGAFADVYTTVSSNNSNQSAKNNATAPKKSGGMSKVLLGGGGILLILGAIGGGVLWFAKRAAGATTYDDQVRLNSFDSAIHTAEPTAPHASESLKEMIMHDKEPRE